MNNRLQELEERIQSRQAEIAIIGLGYVGLPLALAFVRAGFRVFGIDRDEDRVGQLNAGKSYIEDVPADALRAALKGGRFEATSSSEVLSRCDCINICVPTPLRKTKEPDVSHIVSGSKTCNAACARGS